MPPPAILYQSSLRTDARPAGKPRYKYPLPPQSPVQLAAYAFDQEFEMRLSSFPPAPKNTPSTDAAGATFGLADANAILTGYSQPAITGAGMGRFETTFNIVPASWDDFQPLPFTFPGFPGIAGATDVRDIFTDIVLARLHYDYYVIDPNNLAAAVKDSSNSAISRVASLNLIPIVAKSYFVAAPGGVAQPATRTNSITPAGGIFIGTSTWNETRPNLALYKAWQSNAAASGWTSTAWDGSSIVSGTVGQIVAEDSKLQPYAGNIIARVTTYVLVK